MAKTNFRSEFDGKLSSVDQCGSDQLLHKIVGTVFLKLRSNIILEGDVDLAEREAKAFFSSVKRVEHSNSLKHGVPEFVESLHVRKSGCIGFVANSTSLTVKDCAIFLNFAQEIWLLSKIDVECVSSVSWLKIVVKGKDAYACIVPFMACGEILSQTKAHSPGSNDVQDLRDFLSGEILSKRLKAPSTGGTSTQHVHALHKYKAKFFPRLIRSFLVQYLDRLPRRKDGTLALLDPFVGSGTALVEASLLGIESAGVDIDLLSCEISKAKIAALTSNPSQISDALNSVRVEFDKKQLSNDASYSFPAAIAKKFERWKALDEQFSYEHDIATWKSAIASIANPKMRMLFGICLSDALTRKFVIRMMGTGVGRFALEIAKTSLDRLVSSNMDALQRSVFCAQALIEAYALSPAPATVHHGTAVKLPFGDASFSVILTSPPYLPASSGREDYLVGKAISNVALGLMTDEEIAKAEEAAVGSMKWLESDTSGLPDAVIELHNWLANDELRAIKAQPTLAYYVSLKKALNENYRVLLPGGLAIYVIGKESVFYKFSTREVLFRVDCDQIFQDIATSCGFEIEEKVNVELDKKNKNARPRSLDSYYETVFVLRKPN